MSVLIVRAGDEVTFDPSDKRVIQFDWDTENLPATITIATSDWTITPVKQYGPSPLSLDNAAVMLGNRKSQVRLIASTATLGDVYDVANKIKTSEVPDQEKEQSIRVFIENR